MLDSAVTRDKFFVGGIKDVPRREVKIALQVDSCRDDSPSIGLNDDPGVVPLAGSHHVAMDVDNPNQFGPLAVSIEEVILADKQWESLVTLVEEAPQLLIILGIFWIICSILQGRILNAIVSHLHAEFADCSIQGHLREPSDGTDVDGRSGSLVQVGRHRETI